MFLLKEPQPSEDSVLPLNYAVVLNLVDGDGAPTHRVSEVFTNAYLGARKMAEDFTKRLVQMETDDDGEVPDPPDWMEEMLEKLNGGDDEGPQRH